MTKTRLTTNTTLSLRNIRFINSLRMGGGGKSRAFGAFRTPQVVRHFIQAVPEPVSGTVFLFVRTIFLNVKL